MNEGGSVIGSLIYLAIAIVAIAGMWKVFVKAGKPGWAAIIPFYNFYILAQIAGKPGWWFILFILVIPYIIVCMDLAVCFGKSKGWGVGLLFFFGFIGYPLLGFGDAAYTAPAAS